MARIEDDLLECVFYLYPSRTDAEMGRPGGGTGFFISLKSEIVGLRHIYAVTNKHNINECNEQLCIRSKNIRGEISYYESEPHEWFFGPKYDLAVFPFDDPNDSSCPLPAESYLMGHDEVDEYGIGPGDRVFMIGRFVNHDGGKKNIPSVRFGNIATNPGAFKHPKNFQDISWGVEMRSIAGYSGSPVFIYWGHFDHDLGGKNRNNTQAFIALLGVDWGHVNHKVGLVDESGIPLGSKAWIDSAMCGVVPSWDLRALLDSAALKEQRAAVEKQFLDHNKSSIGAIVSD